MSTINIADKTTLDLIDNDTNNLLTRGGIKSDGTNISAYNSTTTNWDNISIGGGSVKNIITIINIDSAFTNKQFTIEYEDYNNLFSTTVIMTGDSVSVEVPYTGTYNISFENDQQQIVTLKHRIKCFGNTIFYPIIIKSFNDATDEELQNILDAHYNGYINIRDYWAIGDTRTIHLSKINKTTNFPEQPAQNLTFMIIGFEMDELIEPISGHSKAAITLNQKFCLSTNAPAGSKTGFRPWLNENYYNAMPSSFKNLIKHVYKIQGNWSGSESSRNWFLTTYEDYCWLLAAKEVWKTTYSWEDENSALNGYPYFISGGDSGRIKGSKNWWLRSICNSSTGCLCGISTAGTARRGLSYAGAEGVSPCICL